MVIERIFVCCKPKVGTAGISIESFYHSNKVPYNLFERWYKNVDIVPVEMIGNEVDDNEEDSRTISVLSPSSPCLDKQKLVLEIVFSNDLTVQHQNVDYPSLKLLIDKLEGSC